ncbi:gluconeogenesis factor YvcK family protein [Vagococcus zengguangii]|uniref:Putative gluconeogenesis factor n=1 Tax=Vagococcus zengguangii TaxID=2571750 RepID=A0A4D7CUY7_9ENTE|nr:YvcK family protein [Vagococcus zengguangii]QCI86157.1 YvcK family protein [Vagococcus zengguangii]
MRTYRINKPKIVVIGGGTGLPVILRGLKNQGADITAIVTVADDGGSSGSLRDTIKMAPPGDLRNVLVSLSEMPKLYEDLFQYRFKKEDDFLANHSVGNLIIAALSEMRGSMYEAVRLLGKIMQVDGNVYPVSEKSLTLHAEFDDGTCVEGESSIAKHRGNIERVYVKNAYDEEQPQAARKVVQAILNADMIVLGPGSLFTSILPNLMVKEVGEALKQTKAEIVYICNIMTQKGETEHFSDANHVQVLHKHLGHKFIDTVIVNIQTVPENYIDNEKYDEYLVQVTHDFKALREEGCRVISADLLKLENASVFHDSDKVVTELFTILYDRKQK